MSGPRPAARLAAISLSALLLGACSVRRMALRQVADTLAQSGSTWESSSDPELVRDGAPFGLLTMESLLEELPDHRQLRLAACRGFTQYAFAFVQPEVERLWETDFSRARALEERARRLYLRGRDHCMHALELAMPGVTAALRRGERGPLASARKQEVPLLFWAGVAWGGAIRNGAGQVGLVAELPAAVHLLERALALDAEWEGGLIHQAMIAVAALPGRAGGGAEEARRHFERAVELSGGHAATPYVAYAELVLVPAQERREFERLLRKALEIDPQAAPEMRLANELAQSRARILLDQADELFLETSMEDDR